MEDSKFDTAKLLFNPKIEKILLAFKGKPKTIKEVSEEIGVMPSRLYYHINKLIQLDLLILKDQKLVNNLVEKYYSSAHLFGEDSTLNFEGDLAIKNKDYLFNQILFTTNQGLKVLDKDFQNAIHKTAYEQNAMYTQIDVNLTQKEWESLHNELKILIKKREQNSSSDVNEYTFSLLSFNKDALKES